MKVVILAGGRGTRLAEETEVRPKPMVEIGGRPILWHIMKHYSFYGFNEFVIALGYKGEMIKRFFLDYRSVSSDMSIALRQGKVEMLANCPEDWTVHLIDTGSEPNTGGRIKRLQPLLQDAPFMVTSGDGVSNVDLGALLNLHQQQGKIATVTAVRPPARYGALQFEGDLVARFMEKPQAGEGWINGGFMVCEPAIFDYLDGDQCSLESDAMEALAADQQLAAYRHPDFWQCMDTVRDKYRLEEWWQTDQAPWRIW